MHQHSERCSTAMPPCCRTIPAFEHALLVRICQLLVTQLQILLDPACDMATQQTELKVVLRVMRTVLRNFYRQLRTKCGVFIEALLAGGVCCLLPAICQAKISNAGHCPLKSKLLHVGHASGPTASVPPCLLMRCPAVVCVEVG